MLKPSKRPMPKRRPKRRAETAETALKLSQLDRQRLQVALTSLGFDTQGFDGVFGPRSRDMILGWQKARNQPATGFLTAAQQQALLSEAAPALAKYDDDLKKADAAAKARAATAPVSCSCSCSVAGTAAGEQLGWRVVPGLVGPAHGFSGRHFLPLGPDTDALIIARDC